MREVAAKIPYWDDLKKWDYLQKWYYPFIAFEGIRLTAKRIINLPIKARDKTISVDFMVINAQ